LILRDRLRSDGPVDQKQNHVPSEVSGFDWMAPLMTVALDSRRIDFSPLKRRSQAQFSGPEKIRNIIASQKVTP
jgi:hypothetical protein